MTRRTLPVYKLLSVNLNIETIFFFVEKKLRSMENDSGILFRYFFIVLFIRDVDFPFAISLPLEAALFIGSSNSCHS